MRLPGRGLSSDVATLTELPRETEKRHGEHEPTVPKHPWSEWYGTYIVARQRGRTPEEGRGCDTPRRRCCRASLAVRSSPEFRSYSCNDR